jgi:NAD+ synthase (glutamine-hydrolysing)
MATATTATTPGTATTIRVALAQVNPCVGDLDTNAELIADAAARAVAAGADVVVFPEMALTGYPIEDLALRPAFREASRRRLDELAADLADRGCGGALVVVGYIDVVPSQEAARHTAGTRDSAAVIHDGRVVARNHKHHLPNYGVFDEQRWFAPGTETTVIRWRGVDFGVVVCEDIWQAGGPVTALAGQVDVLLVPNASPYERDKDEVRIGVIAARAAEVRAPLVYVNLIGGQDDLVFDGGSMVVLPDGSVMARAAQFVEELALVDLDIEPADRPSPEVSEPVLVQRLSIADGGGDSGVDTSDRDAITPVVIAPLEAEAEVWNALVLGLRDYTIKTGFSSVVLGLSGGIDSAVVAALAVDAIGGENVQGVSMPSVYSSEHSKDDAADLAQRTGLRYRVEPIADMVSVFVDQLGLAGVAEENVQSRCRGVTLMGISNAEGPLVLATGNKTELACGYSTIYGDAVGGFAPLKDVFKTWVWRIARWRNAYAESVGEIPPIPENSIVKPPSAELRPGQLDTDSLPDYSLLDQILEGYVEQDQSAADLVAAGFDAATVSRVITMVDRAEWKRRQYPPGTKISSKAFGRDRRLPIVSRWDGD